MDRRDFLRLALAGATLPVVSVLGGCGQSDGGSTQGEPPVAEASTNTLRVGMECAYAPFNWTQDAPTTPDGSEAVPIYGSDYYAYGYDVAVAQMIAEELGMGLEIHKVEWSSIGISMDSGDYDCIIAGMGRTAEREMAYAFTDPYYYRDNWGNYYPYYAPATRSDADAPADSASANGSVLKRGRRTEYQ